MQQFLVPQFIDVEDKIIGPITTRQFILMIVGILTTFILYKTLAFTYFIFFGFIDMALFSVLAFARINGRPMHFFLLNFLQTSKRSKLRVWNRMDYLSGVQVIKSEIKEKPSIAYASRAPVTGSRLRDLSLVVNTGGVYDEAETRTL